MTDIAVALVTASFAISIYALGFMTGVMTRALMEGRNGDRS